MACRTRKRPGEQSKRDYESSPPDQRHILGRFTEGTYAAVREATGFEIDEVDYVSTTVYLLTSDRHYLHRCGRW